MPNLYERVVEYDNEADRASNTNPRILESTYDTSIGQDTDNEIIRSKNEGDNKVRQISWVGGAAPTDGGSTGFDVYTFTVWKTGNAQFMVIANQTTTTA